MEGLVEGAGLPCLLKGNGDFEFLRGCFYARAEAVHLRGVTVYVWHGLLGAQDSLSRGWGVGVGTDPLSFESRATGRARRG
jgi:hypothetical protein